MRSFADNKLWHYCKQCDKDFLVNIPSDFTGDAILQCTCSRQHSRQFLNGVAVSCEAPRSKPTYFGRSDGKET